jgi:hypothetical protein
MGVGMISVRPPVMTLLGLPWGSIASWEAAGKCFVTLAALISLLVALCLYLLLRMGVKPLILVLSSLCLVASLGPYPGAAGTHGDAAAFMTDTLFAWTILAALLLIPYEANVLNPSTRSGVLRGLLWAMVFSMGLMTKLSFLYFVVLVVPILFYIRLRRLGLGSAGVALLALACGSTPCAIYLLRWGSLALQNARASSYGRLADLYRVPLMGFLARSIRVSPGLAFSCCLMAIGIAYAWVRQRKKAAAYEFLALLIMFGFALMVLGSPNRQIRYSFPAMVALPFLVGRLVSAGGESVPGRSAALIAGLVFCSLCAASVPTRRRADRESIRRCDAILAQAVKCKATRVLLATDSPTLNRDLMDLAAEFRPPGTSLDVSTLAYQAMVSAPIEEDFREISRSDVVVVQDRKKLNPPVTNSRVPEYERYIKQRGYVPVRVGDDLSVYLIRQPLYSSEAQSSGK